VAGRGGEEGGTMAVTAAWTEAAQVATLGTGDSQFVYEEQRVGSTHGHEVHS